MQACLLQTNINELINSYNYNNSLIKTLNYYTLFTKTLKIIFNLYDIKISNLIKFMIFNPSKCIRNKKNSFWDYLPIIESIGTF